MWKEWSGYKTPDSCLSMSVKVSNKIAELAVPEVQWFTEICQSDCIPVAAPRWLRVCLHPKINVEPGISISSKASKYSGLLFRDALATGFECSNFSVGTKYSEESGWFYASLTRFFLIKNCYFMPGFPTVFGMIRLQLLQLRMDLSEMLMCRGAVNGGNFQVWKACGKSTVKHDVTYCKSQHPR